MVVAGALLGQLSRVLSIDGVHLGIHTLGHMASIGMWGMDARAWGTIATAAWVTQVRVARSTLQGLER